MKGAAKMDIQYCVEFFIRHVPDRSTTCNAGIVDRMSIRAYRFSAVLMIALPPSGVATDSVQAVASLLGPDLAHRILRRPGPGALASPTAAWIVNDRFSLPWTQVAGEHPNPLAAPVITATRSSNLRSDICFTHCQFSRPWSSTRPACSRSAGRQPPSLNATKASSQNCGPASFERWHRAFD